MKSKPNRGSVAVVCLAMMSIVMVITLAITAESVTRLAITRHNIERNQAQCIAEAGVDYGIAMVKANASYAGTGGSVEYGDGSFTVVVSSSGGQRIIASTGISDEGAEATVQASVDSGAGMNFPNGAIVANGDVNLGGQADCFTTPSNQHQASVHANGNASIHGQAEVDGDASAHGTVTMNGQADVWGDVTSGAPRVSFPDAAAHEAWMNELKAEAMAGTTKSGNISGNVVWNTPVYVNGNLSLSSKATLTIVGGGIVYVKGSISVSGQAKMYNSGILVAEGKISQSGQSQYVATGSLTKIGLVSFDQNSGGNHAISITGQGSSVPMGLVYAAYGGIKVSGQGDVYGALVAAGANGAGSVQISGQGDLYYPVDLLQNTEILPSSFAVRSWLEL